MKEPMKLEVRNEGAEGIYLVLDGKELHHVEAYEIKSSAFAGKRELSLKMLVSFPAMSDEKPEASSDETIKTTKQIADEIFEYLKKAKIILNRTREALDGCSAVQKIN